MSFLSALDISGSALTAQKLRMDIISQNLANANTTRTEGGGPYVRQTVVLTPADVSGASAAGNFSETGKAQGVAVSQVVEDTEGLKSVYDPTHPDADENGYVAMPNVDTVKEMIDMISATRSYEANITAFNAVKQMAAKALDIGR
jgi:flagellar basal-body rod protein FlgC